MKTMIRWPRQLSTRLLTLAEAKAKTLGNTLGNVKVVALVDTQADTWR